MPVDTFNTRKFGKKKVAVLFMNLLVNPCHMKNMQKVVHVTDANVLVSVCSICPIIVVFLLAVI